MAKPLKFQRKYISALNASEQVYEACAVLEHYHFEHTKDQVTRIRGELRIGELRADIYIVSDPIWKKKLSDCVAPIML